MLGANIKRQRLARGLSQAALGRAIGVKQQQIAKYENDTNEPSIMKLRQIAGVLGVHVSDLSPLLADFPAQELSADEVRLLNLLRQMPDARREQLIRELGKGSKAKAHA